MTRVLTSRHCHLVISGFTRHHYSNLNAVPLAIIALMASFLNLWQHFRFTEEQLGKVRKVTTGCDTLIYFHDVRIQHMPSISISLRIRVSVGYDPWRGKYVVDFWLDFKDLPHVDFIGGYFDFCWPQKENDWISFSRSGSFDRDGTQKSDGLVEGTKVISIFECRELKEFAFSMYFDVQQIAFKSGPLEDIDNLSPLKGYGRHQWIIDGEELSKLIQGDEVVRGYLDGGWDLYLWNRLRFGDLSLYLRSPFVPLYVSEFDVRIKGIGTIQNKRNKSTYDLRCNAGKTRRFEFENVIHKNINYPPTVLDLTYNQVQMASSITLEIEWEVIKVVGFEEDVDCSDVDKSVWKDLGICMEK